MSTQYSVRFENVPPDERVWFCIWSQLDAECRQQKMWSDTAKADFIVANITNDEGDTTQHAILAFTRGRQPILRLLTREETSLDLTFADELVLPIRFWILFGEEERQTVRILNSLLFANSVLLEQNTGIRFELEKIIDVATDAVGSPLLAGEDQGAGNDWSDIEFIMAEVNKIGRNRNLTFRTDCINVFLVNEIIDAKGTHGKHAERRGTRGTAIALDQYAFDDLLVHEIGHALALPDIDTKPDDADPIAQFHPRNVMQRFCTRRDVLSEGQIAKMHFSDESAVVDVYGLRDRMEMNRWFLTSERSRLPLMGLCLTQSRRYDAHHTSPGATILPPSPTMGNTFLTAIPFGTRINGLEDLVQASRERFRRRTAQLHRELARSGDERFLRLLGTAIEEYVVSDISQFLAYAFTH